MLSYGYLNSALAVDATCHTAWYVAIAPSFALIVYQHRSHAHMLAGLKWARCCSDRANTT